MFSDPNDLASSSTITDEVTLQRLGRLTCQTHKVYLKVSGEAIHVYKSLYVTEIASIAQIEKLLNLIAVTDLVTNFL